MHILFKGCIHFERIVFDNFCLCVNIGISRFRCCPVMSKTLVTVCNRFLNLVLGVFFGNEFISSDMRCALIYFDMTFGISMRLASTDPLSILRPITTTYVPTGHR